MAADKPKFSPSILELLYPDEVGELDEAELRALRDAADLSAADARDLEALEAMLARIRAEDPAGAPVRASVHDSIMAAARAQNESAPARVQVAEASRPAPKPIWARIPMNTGRQLALAASVLLVAGAFFILTRQPEPKFETASSATTADITFEAPAPAPRAQAPRPEALAAADEVDKSEQTERQQATGAEPSQAPAQLALNTGRGSDSHAGSPPEGMAAPRSSERAAPSRAESRAPSSARRRAARKAAAPAKRKSRASAAPLAESALAGDLAAKDSAPAAQNARSLADRTDDDLESEAFAEKSEHAPPAPEDTSKLDAIAESFASAHYDETIARADLLAGDPSVPDADVAQARELKARAQEARGDTGGALDTYLLIQARHPTFKTGVIAAHIRRLEQLINNQPKRRERAAPMNSVEPMHLDSLADE